MTLLTMLIGLWALLLAAKGTPAGRWLERWLVAKPAAALLRIHRNTVLAAGVLILGAILCWVAMGQEGLLMFGFGLPEATAALAMIDLGVLVDIAVVLAATAGAGGRRAIHAMIARWRAPSRAARVRRVKRPRKPAANDDCDGPGFALAA
jgi:hypothetical protein